MTDRAGYLRFCNQVFFYKAATLHTLECHITSSRIKMASGGCVSVSHLSTPYSTSRSTFSIKNILNLQEDKNEDHQKFPSGSKQADTYLSSSFPLIPRATRSHFLHAPTCYSDFKINFSRVHNLRPVAQMNQFPFPSYGSSFGEFNQGDKPILVHLNGM